MEASDIDVIDVTGKIVKQFKGSFEANSNFDISNLVRGMYFVKVKSNQRFETTLKLIKQ